MYGTYNCDYDSSNIKPNFRDFEKSQPQINTVPKRKYLFQNAIHIFSMNSVSGHMLYIIIDLNNLQW